MKKYVSIGSSYCIYALLLLSVHTSADAAINEKLTDDGLYSSLAKFELRIYMAIICIGGSLIVFLLNTIWNKVSAKLDKLDANDTILTIQIAKLQEKMNNAPTREEMLKLHYKDK